MHDHLGRELTVVRPREKSKIRPERLLCVSDDQTPGSGNSDALSLIEELGRQQGRSVTVITLSDSLSWQWIRQIWSRIVEYSAVHLQLSRTSLTSPPVISLLIVARFFGRTTSAVISGPTADLDGDTLRRHSFVLRLIDGFAVQSPYLLERLRRHDVKCRLVPPVLADSWFPERTVSAVQPAILWAGECDEQSHLSVAVKAYQTVKKKYPRAELIIACPEAATSVLADSMGSEAGIRVVDSRNAEELVKAYEGADVYLNTSIVDSQPLALMRALATGLPVISAAVGTLKQMLVDGQSALLLPLDDHTGYADAIIDLVESEELSSRLSEAGKRTARAFRRTAGVTTWRGFLGVGS